MVLQLKQMEVQLEEEYEDKQKVLREKRELESKLTTLSDQVSVSGDCCLGPGQLAAPSGLRDGNLGHRKLGIGRGVLGSVEFALSTCGRRVINIRCTPRLFSLAGMILALPLALFMGGTLRI